MPRQYRPCRVPGDIEKSIRTYLGDRNANDRYASFDYCYNYFQSFRERDNVTGIAANLQLSCLQLGFYLASWGMLRGSTDLIRRSARHLAPLVEEIAIAPTALWDIDAHAYSDESFDALSEFGRKIRKALPGAVSDTLVTKIMSGVFGNVPAFDTYFKRGSGLSTYGHHALRRVEAFYAENSAVIDRYRIPTLDFDTGGDTKRTYTRAKVIDMIFFVEGA